MLANSEILNLSKVSLETKELLPEYSGIYYVVDENNLVWYIGKAKNIRKRWKGKAHHRIYQLQQLNHQQFYIYYEQVDLLQLDKREKQQIEKYNPHLNNSPVKTKKVRPTETQLRETIAKIRDFAFILGVEPPRREVKDKISIGWLIQERWLDLPIIHICLDLAAFKTLFNPQSFNEQEALIKKIFSSRKAYASKWDGFPKGYPFMFRLYVNGFIIEVNYLSFWTENNKIEIPEDYNCIKIAQESIEVLTSESLVTIQSYNLVQQRNEVQLQSLKPYILDLIPLFFNESIDTYSAKKELEKVSKDYKTGKRGVGSRSSNADLDLAINELLISRGIDPQKYSIGEAIPISMPGRDKIGLCIKSFGVNLKREVRFFVMTTGMLDNELRYNQSLSQFDTLYLLSGVERKAWLLVEQYLQDFAKPSNKLKNGEGYTEKYFVSARKYLVPAKVNIKLENLQYSAWIPFGINEQYPTFKTAKQEIKKRLNEANLPGLKLTFKKESIAK